MALQLSVVALLIIASCLCAHARLLKDANATLSWTDEATPVTARQDCGRSGQKCCVTVAKGSVPSVSAFCADDTLYCQSFPQGVLLSNASVALLSYTGPPALCLPKPVATCGVAGAPCCPLTGNATDLSLRCTDADTICLTDPSFSANLTGLLTAADYQRLLADPNATLSEAEQRSVWGSCQTFPADTCGAPQGLCGPRLPAPATQCPQEVQGCEEGYFCQLQEGQLQQVGLCEPVPEGAGKLGSQCLPAGNYSDGFVATTPFCNDTAYITQFDIYCAAPLGQVNGSECLRLPTSPDECGGEGKPCCPSSYHVTTDRPLPSVCQTDFYCAAPSLGADPVCIANPAGAGMAGSPCFATSAKNTTLYSCDSGSYCNGGLGAKASGLTQAGQVNLTCTRCGSALDVPIAYQSVCGIGVVDSTATSATMSASGSNSTSGSSSANSGVEGENKAACENCM